MQENAGSYELLPPEGDEYLGQMVFNLAENVLKEKSKKGLVEKWNRNYELYKSKHWKNDSKKASLVTANVLATHVNRTANMLTDNNPTFNISRIGESSPETEQIYTGLLRAAERWWSDQEQQHILERSVKNGEIYGCTVEKVIFNPDAEFALGEAETVLIDPYYFGFYPAVIDGIQKAEAILHFHPMTIRAVQRRWPEYANDVMADSEMIKALGDTRQEVQANSKQRGGFFSSFSGVVKFFANDADNSLGPGEEQTLVIEAWVKDYTSDEEGIPLYPGYIRQVTVCNGGKVVLEDRGNPSINPALDIESAAKTYLYDKFPFSFTQSNTDTPGSWGISDFEQLETLQIELNKALSQFTTFKDKVARPKIINPIDTGVKNSELTNMVGVINPSSAMSAQGLRWLDAPQIPADLLEGIKLYKEFFFLVSGSFELESAQTPGREVVSYKAIATLVERASMMLKGKIRNYGKMIRERGRMYLSHVMNWYTEDRWVTADSGGDQEAMQIRGIDMIVPAKLTVVSGSTMPRSKVQEREEALDLFVKGAIDAEELLQKMDWPDYKKVVQRIQAGPLGAFIKKMGETGAPEAILQYMQEISQMEDRDVTRALKREELAPFMAIMQQAMSGGEEQGNPAEEMTAQSELMVKQAQTEKLQAETQLVYEKIRTEQVQQQVQQAGAQFDVEKLKIERARTVADIEQQRHAQKMDRFNAVSGVKAKNQEMAVKEKDTEIKAKSVDKKTQGPYREKGMSSNNKDGGK